MLNAPVYGTAIKYVAAHLDGLCVFLEHPSVPIDNNSVERGFRGPALGRNNLYGSHSRRGTEVTAIMYSLVESAKLNGVDRKRYLKLALAAALDGRTDPASLRDRRQRVSPTGCHEARHAFKTDAGRITLRSMLAALAE